MTIEDYKDWAKKLNYEPDGVDMIISMAYKAGEYDGAISELKILVKERETKCGT